jgi:hypothetical protein
MLFEPTVAVGTPDIAACGKVGVYVVLKVLLSVAFQVNTRGNKQESAGV